jgi:hypothetical protein
MTPGPCNKYPTVPRFSTGGSRVLKQGVLLKQSDWLGQWRSRFARLSCDQATGMPMLEFFANEADARSGQPERLRLRIGIAPTMLQERPVSRVSSGAFAFTLETMTQGKVLYLRAQTAAERLDWVNKINESVHSARPMSEIEPSGALQHRSGTFVTLPSELWVHVIAQGGPALLSLCSALQKHLRCAIHQSSELYRALSRACFTVTHALAWRDVFIECSSKWDSQKPLRSWAGQFSPSYWTSDVNHRISYAQFWSPGSKYVFQPFTGPEAVEVGPTGVVFARGMPSYSPLSVTIKGHTDPTGEFWDYPATHATEHEGPETLRRSWCTSRMHHSNVGLLVDLGTLALVTGVGVVNPADGFDCPVKLCLAFASMDDPGGIAGAMRRAARYMDGGRDARARATVTRLEASSDQMGKWDAWGRSPAEAGDPCVAINFPEPPACDGMHIVRACAPTAARWLHFLIVSAYNPNRHEEPNVDVCKLQVFGIPLAQTEERTRWGALVDEVQHERETVWGQPGTSAAK